MHRPSERTVHLVFVVTLWLKAAFAAGEILAGVATWFVSKELVLRIAVAVTHHELAEDPGDRVANYILHAAQHLSMGAKTFAAVYLLAHGLIKLCLVIGLLRVRLWYYPVAIVVFLGFIVYQVYRYVLHASPLLLLLTVLDLVVIVLTWHEWRYLRGRVAEGRRA